MDYLKHLLIRTPVEPVALNVRRLWTSFKLRKHPELREVFREPELMDLVLARVLARDSNCLDVGSHLGSMLVRFLLFESTKSGHIAFGVSADDVFDFLSGHEYSVFLLRDFLEDRPPLGKRSFREAHDYPFKAFNFFAVRRRPAA